MNVPWTFWILDFGFWIEEGLTTFLVREAKGSMKSGDKPAFPTCE